MNGVLHSNRLVLKMPLMPVWHLHRRKILISVCMIADILIFPGRYLARVMLMDLHLVREEAVRSMVVMLECSVV